MKKIKNILTAVFIATLCISLTACGTYKRDSSKTSLSGDAQTEAYVPIDPVGYDDLDFTDNTSDLIRNDYDDYTPIVNYDDYGYTTRNTTKDTSNAPIVSTAGNEEKVRSNNYDTSIFDYNNTPQTFVTNTEHKLIKSYHIFVETEDVDAFESVLQTKINELEGYVDIAEVHKGSKDSNDKGYAKLTVRIPADSSSEFIDSIDVLGNVTDQSQYTQDVTLSYTDIETKKRTYEYEKEKLFELLSQATSLDDILRLEDRITKVRYNLESIESQLRAYDNEINYSTFYVRVSEVEDYTEPYVAPKSFGQKAGQSFLTGINGLFNGLSNFIIILIGSIPGLMFLALIGFGVYRLTKHFINKKKPTGSATPMPQVMPRELKDNKEDDLK